MEQTPAPEPEETPEAEPKPATPVGPGGTGNETGHEAEEAAANPEQAQG